MAIVLTFAIGLSVNAEAENKSLCSFPFGPDGNFEVLYDQRTYDSDYYNSCSPNGGIKLSLWLGNFSNSTKRNNKVKNIKYVRFINNTNKSALTLRKADKYKYVDNYSAEYSVWCGHQIEAVGEWFVKVRFKDDTYTADFEITEEMLEQLAPIPVKPQVLAPVGDTFEIIAPITNGDQYRLRIIENGKIITNDNMNIVGDYVRYSYPISMMGKRARIETRIYNTDWPVLKLWGVPDSCDRTGMNIGGSTSRSMTYFETTVIN